MAEHRPARPDTRTRREKLEAMAADGGSLHEAEIAKRLLAAMGDEPSSPFVAPGQREIHFAFALDPDFDLDTFMRAFGEDNLRTRYASPFPGEEADDGADISSPFAAPPGPDVVDKMWRKVYEGSIEFTLHPEFRTGAQKEDHSG